MGIGAVLTDEQLHHSFILYVSPCFTQHEQASTDQQPLSLINKLCQSTTTSTSLHLHVALPAQISTHESLSTHNAHDSHQTLYITNKYCHNNNPPKSHLINARTLHKTLLTRNPRTKTMKQQGTENITVNVNQTMNCFTKLWITEMKTTKQPVHVNRNLFTKTTKRQNDHLCKRYKPCLYT